MRAKPLVLVDTNVWLDSYLGSRPGSASSCALIESAISHGATLLYPAHIAKDIAYLIEQCLKREIEAEDSDEANPIDESTACAVKQIAMNCVQNMSEVAVAVGADGSDVWLALKYWPLTGDMEDAFVIAAAERASVDMIVTRDKGLASKAPFPTFTPEDAIVLLETMQQD